METREIKETCPECGGVGWIEGCKSGHGCNGTYEDCAVTCPVPIQTQEGCEFCGGEGLINPTL